MKRKDDDDFIIIGPGGEDGEAVTAEETEVWLDTEAQPHELPVEKDTEFEPEEEACEQEEDAGGEEECLPYGEYSSGQARPTVPAQPVKRRRRLFGGDSVLWVVMITLLILSIFITYSAQIYKVDNPSKTLLMQFVFIGLGIAVLWLVHIIKYQFYRRIARSVWIAGIILTLCGAVYGLVMYKTGVHKALNMRDLPLGFTSFQPLELLKIGMVMLLAMQLAGRQKNIADMKILPSFRPSEWKQNAQEQVDIIRKQTIPIFGPILVTCVISFIVVGNSTTMIIAATCFTMLFIGRVRRQDIVKLLGLAGGVLLVMFLIGLGRSDTGKSRMARFTPDMYVKYAREVTVTDLDGDTAVVEIYSPPIKGYDKDNKPIVESDQAIAAKMAVASGELIGKGPGMSTLRSKLPEAEKDYAYALLIEEYGTLGGAFVMLLFLWLFFRTIQIFKKCGTAFPSLLILGLGVMITIQAMMHMMVNVGLFPVAGQQLPLISKGGSSLVFTLFALGMILGVSRQTANNTLDAPKDQSLFEK